MQKVRIGLIGLGFMGTTHFGIHKANPDAEIVALADVDEAKRRGDISSVSANLGDLDSSKPLDLSGIHVYESGFDLIRDPRVDVVDICTPTEFHADLIVAALAAGKHVFSEKPLCRNEEEFARIRKAVSEAKTFINFGLCIRAWPEYEHFCARYRKGDFGNVLSATFRRLSPSVGGGHWEDWFLDGDRSGGAILDLHTHDTDFIVHLLGRPRAVSSFGRCIVSRNNGIDHVITVYDYGNGMLVESEGGWGAPASTPFEMSFQAICEKATVRFMSEGFKIYWNDGSVETPQVEATTGWHVELRYFIDCVRNGIVPDKYQTPQSVFDSFRVVTAERASVRSGKSEIVHY